MGKEDSRKIETEAASPCPAPAWIKLGVCLTGCSAKKKKKNGHWLCEAECTVENSGLELFFSEGALSLLISFFLPRLSPSLLPHVLLLQKLNRKEKSDAMLITF